MQKRYLPIILFSFILPCVANTSDSETKTTNVPRKNAIVLGASSGMGRELAKLLDQQGYSLGLVARRKPLLESLQKELKNPSYIETIDVTEKDARKKLSNLIERMNGIDLIVISISPYLDNRNSFSPNHLDYNVKKRWEEKERTIDVDCKGFLAMADVAFYHLMKQNSGHFVGISSSMGLKGAASSPEYSGVKACLSTYMDGMRNLMARENLDVLVTDVIPGFVAVEHSPLGEDPHVYWEISVEEAGKIIIQGILEKKKNIYVPSKTWLLSLLKFLPDCIYQYYFNWM